MGKIQAKRVTFHKSAIQYSQSQQIKFKSKPEPSIIKQKAKVSLKLTNIKDKAVKKNLKKRKMHLRRDSLKKKLEKGKKSDLEKIAELKRKQTVIVGDMQPMLTALMDNIAQDKSTKKEMLLAKKNKKFTVKNRMKEIADGLEYFKNALDINK